MRYVMMLQVIFFTFVSYCYSQEIKDIEKIRELSTETRVKWETVKQLTYFTKDINTFILELKKLPKFDDGGIVDLISSQYIIQQLYREDEILVQFSKILTPSNIVECFKMLEYDLRIVGNFNMIENYQSCIFPLKIKSQLDFTSLMEWDRNPYPISDHNYAYSPLSLAFENLGLYDLAWRVQMEEGIHEYDDISPYHEYRSYYLRAANTVYRSDNKKLGWSFLMNAAVFEPEQSFEMAMKTAELWLDVEAGKKTLPKAEILSGDERKKVFLEIVKRYQEMNAHPRAWLFVQEYKNEFDNADTLIKTIQDDWLDIVKMVTNPRIAEKIIMYGVELYPTKNDPLSIQLPWAFPEGSIEKLKKTLQEEAERIRGEEKDDFRFWGDATEYKKHTKAKYESCLGGNVTLIKQDGDKIVRRFSELWLDDQQYVRRHLDIARVEKAKPRELIYPIRPWHSANGKFSTEARYLSSTDKDVQMEKDDGTVIRVELSKLSPQDQNYVQQCKKMVETMQHKNVKKK